MTEESDALKRILVVDDDELLQDFYQRVLSMQGYVVICLANGQEAEDFLRTDSGPIDLVIVNLLMPIKSGWELIQMIKADDTWKETTIMVITGVSPSFPEYEKVQEVCDVIMQKGDFEITKFTETITNLLEYGESGPTASPA